MKINRLSTDKHEYLQILTSIAKPPSILYSTGSIPTHRIPTVAIVGTRKPTPYGQEVAHELAFSLARLGVVTISGLALGIDAIAHRAALEAGGITLAILGNGLPNIYPATHKELARTIVANGGALLSEYEPETPARTYHFLERNRIVSGLSDAIIIVEAAARSGTLNTASHAIEQGREVFVVPGNITSPLSAGCNALIKQGAQIVTSASDVMEVIAPQMPNRQSSLPLGSTPLESAIISLLQSGVRDGDILQQRAKAEVSEFNQTLTLMEINGVIRALGSNQWTLR